MKIGGAFVVTLLSAASAICFSLPSQAADQVVTSLLDDPDPGRLTLREALGLVSNRETITFDKGLAGQTIRLNPSRGPLDAGFRTELTITAEGLLGGVIIDGNEVSGSVMRLSDMSRVVNLTFSGGRTNQEGGGLLAGYRSTIEGCTFRDNRANSGGGLYAVNSVVTNCTFIGNTAGSGGGLYIGRGSFPPTTVSYCEFTDNRASNMPSGSGGAVASADENGTISHCIFGDNRSDNVGGAIAMLPDARGGSINNCLFAQNMAIRDGSALYVEAFYGDPIRVTGSAFVINGDAPAIGVVGRLDMDLCIVDRNGTGPGIAVQERGSLNMRNCSVHGNRSHGIVNNGSLVIDRSEITGNDGSGIDSFSQQTSQTLTINESTIADNSSGAIRISMDPSVTAQISKSTISDNSGPPGSQLPGGISIYRGRVAVSDSTISANRTHGSGGGIWVESPADSIADLQLTACTIAHNQVDGRGGGIYVSPGPNARVHLNNVLVANNSDGPNLAPDVFGGIDSLGHNLVRALDGSTGWGPTDLTGTIEEPLDPLINKLAFSGGLTQTHGLSDGSPAIGTGNPALSGTVSQNDVTRGASVDIGAYQTPDRGGSPLRGRVEIFRPLP